MTTVTIEDKKIRLSGLPSGDLALPLLSGEVHYWRLDPANWCAALQRAREMGLDIVATYVCWDFHELQAGHHDFSGKSDPRRDLSGFLDLCAAEDLWVIIRPGPYIYSEWRNNGVPDYAAQHHRLDPAFQEAAAPYMTAVAKALRPHLATQGGRIILWQADNEIDPWPHLYTEELGLGNKAGPFQRFLQQKYGSIEALNEGWCTSYADFDEARATRLMQPEQPDMMRRYLDFVRFGHWYVNEVARWATNCYRDLGVDVPIILNTYSGVATQRWADMEAIADVVGPDIYPSNEFAHRSNEHRNFLDMVRYTRTYSRLPYIPEFEAGIWDDWLADVRALTPNHYRLMCLSAMLAGAAGWNWYMLVNRDNWYLSPINEWGRTRPQLFEAFQQIVALFKEVDAPALAKLSSTALTYDPLPRGTTRPGQALLQAFYDAGIDYEFYDPERGACGQRGCRHRLLFYAGEHWASDAVQRNLLRYVEDGGHLVLLGAFPRFDDELRSHNVLEIPMPEGIVSSAPGKRPVALDLGDGGAPADDASNKVHSSWFYNYQNVPGEPISVELLESDTYSAEELALQFNLQRGVRYTVGYSQQRGQGQLTVVGLEPSPALILALHAFAGVSMPVRSATPGVQGALFENGDDLYLIAANNGDEEKTATFVVDRDRLPNASYQVEDLLSREATRKWCAAENERLTVTLPRKDGTILRLKAV